MSESKLHHCLPILAILITAGMLIASCAKPVHINFTRPVYWQQKDLLITYSCSAPPTEKNIAAAASENFNVIPASEEALKYAGKYKLKIMLEHGLLEPPTVRSPEKLKQLATLIERVKNNPALAAYYIVDEPQASAFPEIAKLIAYIRQRDPKHLCFVNLQQIYGIPGEKKTDPAYTYMKYLNNFIDVVKPDLLSYDYYNFFRQTSGNRLDGNVYFVHLYLVRLASLKSHIPFMNVAQACNFENNWRLPNANEMRWQVYTSLAYGAKGMNYFLYWGPKAYGGLYQDGMPTPLIGPISKLNQEMKAMSHELMSLESTNVFHTAPLPFGTSRISDYSPVQIISPGPYVLGLFGTGGKTTAFMLVNRDYLKPATATLLIPGKQEIKEFDRDKGIWDERPCTPESTKSPSGMFIVNLAPGDGRLFRL